MTHAKDEALKLALELIERVNRGGWILADFEDEMYTAITAIKEALAQPAQEPVAWMTVNEYGEEDDIHYENPEGHLLDGWTYKPLYTHPPTAQPAQEPLEYWNAVEGWVKIDEIREHFDSVGCGTIYKTAGEDRVPVYTTPPAAQPVQPAQRKPLTNGEIYTAYITATNQTLRPQDERLAFAFARAIEAKLKEKNHVI